MIESWPTPSRTAESPLVSREGNDVVFLNELGFQKDTALRLRGPVERTETPAITAVLGRRGVVGGTDYRGDAAACVQPHERLTIDMRANAVALRDYEDVDWIVERLRSDRLISRSSFVRLIAQGMQLRWVMDAGDYRSQQYDPNLLYGWEFHPGSMFYLAYNQTVERRDDINDYLDPVVVAKVTYLFGL